MGTWMLYVTFATLLVATAAQTCQRDWLNAEFVVTSVGDQDVDLLTATSLGFDPTFSYFRDVIQFTDEETERFIQDAINFYRMHYGLNFSGPPDDLGRRFFQNATLFPYRVTVNFTATSNNYIANGRTRSKCFLTREGGLTVSFSGEQMLHGAYGGEDGRPSFPGESIDYGFFSLSLCPNDLFRVQVRSLTPNRSTQVDGFVTINYGLFNRQLGSGVGQGTFRFLPSVPGVSFKLIARFAFQFPDLAV